MPIMRCLYRQTVNKKQRPQTINTLVVWDFCFCRIFFCRVLDIRVAKIVEANMWHIVFFQKSFEMRCKVIRFNDFSNFIHIDIVEIVCTITGTAEFPVFFLIFSHLKQDCLIRCNKRKGTAAGFCLCSVAGNNLKFTINLCLLNGMLDCNGLLFKINGIPL